MVQKVKNGLLHRSLTTDGACRTGSCSGWVGEWTVSGCEGLAHHRTPPWITQASPQTWVMCCIWCYKGYDVTRGQEFFRSIIIAWDHCDTVYVVGHWVKDGYVARPWITATYWCVFLHVNSKKKNKANWIPTYFFLDF